MSNETKPWLFKKGHSGGPGRPPKKKINYREVIEQCATEEAIFQVFDRCIKDAIGGSIPAARLVLSYVASPVPKTLQISDSTTKSRSLADTSIESLAPEEFQALTTILAKVDGRTDE